MWYPLDTSTVAPPEPAWTIWRQFLTLLGLELQPLGRPARSQSLYRLRYRGSTFCTVYSVNLPCKVSGPSCVLHTYTIILVKL
jgi:hypothetical protein